MNIQSFRGSKAEGLPNDEIVRDALAPIFRRSIFWTPERQASSAWVEHVPFAFWLVDVLRPRRIVELGTYNGVSYSAMCQAVKALELATSCFAIDTWKGDEHGGFYEEDVYRELAAFHDQRFGAFSQLLRSTFDEALRYVEDGSIDLLHIDGLHTYEAVRHDYESWLPKLAANAVVLFHDTNVRERDFGVFRLWNEITTGKPHFAFLHGYGLGVLGYGQDHPEALHALFSANEDSHLVSSIRETFATLGRSVRTLYERLSLDQALSKRTSEINGLHNALRAREEELTELKQRLLDSIGETASLRQSLSERTNELAVINRAMAERTTEIGTLEQALAKRTDEFAVTNRALAERTTEIATLQQTLANRGDKIHSLGASTSRPAVALLHTVRHLTRRLLSNIFGYTLVLGWRAMKTRSLAPLRDWRAIRIIARSGLFDKGWYLKNNPDVAASGLDPVWHYVMHGVREARDPYPSFSTTGYLARNADVLAAGINPLAHFLLCGAAEGRDIGKFNDGYGKNRQSIDATENSAFDGFLNRITILATKHTLFIAHLIDSYMSKEGYIVSIADRYEPSFEYRGIYIVICPQMFAELPPEFVAFQMEQSTNSRWFNDRYKMILSNALAVLDYSLTNIAYLIQCEIPNTRLFHVPISPVSGYLCYLVSKGYKINLSSCKKTDVVFYGDVHCARRREFLNKLRERLDIKVVTEVYGNDLINELIAARVVINVHYYDSALLETTRICEALSVGVPIVSEESVDIEQYEGLRTVVEFTRIGDAEAMIAAVERLLSDEEAYKQRLEQIRSFVNITHSFGDYLKRFLVAQRTFPYKRFLDTTTLLANPLPTTPKICLSIPEIAARRSAFIERNRDFFLFDGIKYRPGWVGCAMSYKYIFSKLLDTDCPRAIICEDDVLFEEHFSERLGIITRFLESTRHPWDIFSGLIADVHPDTEILRIAQFEDNEFIYINKMTSMVFNIYNRSAFSKIATWDENNRDIRSNTIDRYLESSSEIITVTTLPFLVGHDEDLSSSLWGFQNSAYSTMFKKSQKLLERKVAKFKAQSKL